MPTDYAIKDGRTVMDVSLWTGTGSAQTITNSGFKPDLVWAKNRNDTFGHVVDDTVRGAALTLQPQSTAAEVNEGSNGLVAFNSNGFNIGGGSGGWNVSTKTYVGWQWNAGSGNSASNTSGSITSTVSANPTAGFSIVTYTGPGPSNNTVGHGLGAVPKLIITKNRSRSVYWIVYTATTGKDAFLRLNTTDASTSSTSIWGTSAPTSTVFGGVGTDASNGYVAGDTLVSYCWAEIAGFSKFGSYTGNGSADGTFIYTGFRPKFIMVKRTDAISNWWLMDSSRNTANVMGQEIYPNLANAEAQWTGLDFLSNGVKFRTTDGAYNGSGATYIYACFAENPFKYANAR